jgi:hypothetical protein
MIGAMAVALATVAGACGNDGATESAPEVSSTVGSADLPQGSESVELDPASFTVDIDNPYWPMAPGTQWTYAEIDDDGSLVEVVATVTADTKTVASGIEARVVRDTVRRDGEIIEDTFDWYAQDSDGNVWYLGEDTAELEDGEITTKDGSFEAGADGALPGVIMPAEPQEGMTYRQEYYAGQAEDNGEILRVGELVETSFGQYDDALVTRDFITIEPDVLEYKFYVPGIGPVLTLSVSGGGGGREELISMEQVDPATVAGPLGEPAS